MQRSIVVFLVGSAATFAFAASTSAAIIARGAFFSIGDEPAAGVVMLVAVPGGGRVLRFTKSAIGPGPALHIYLVAGNVNASVDVKVFKDLGWLKATRGSQAYTIPRGLDTRRFHTVVVWCAEFKVAFGRALLTPVRR